jgi:CelD/BcsL family acetyltransferase involved in cellulose biosynthesis
VRQLYFNSTGEDAFDCVTIEYTDFSGPGTNDPALWPAFLDWFAADAQIDELIVPGVAAARIVGMRISGRLLEVKRNVPAFRVCGLPSIVDGGLESRLSRNSRQQLRRSLRHYLELGPLHIEEARTVEQAQSYFTALRNLHIRSWTERGKQHAFRHAFFEKFHRALIGEGIPNGSVQLLQITAGDHAIGYLYNFRRGKRIYAYQSGFDSHKGLRPGYVCHALAIAHNAAEGAEIYDFLAGDNRLKQSFSDSRYIMSWCTYRQRKLRFQAEMIAWSAASRLAALRPGPAGLKAHPDDNSPRPE